MVYKRNDRISNHTVRRDLGTFPLIGDSRSIKWNGKRILIGCGKTDFFNKCYTTYRKVKEDSVGDGLSVAIGTGDIFSSVDGKKEEK